MRLIDFKASEAYNERGLEIITCLFSYRVPVYANRAIILKEEEGAKYV
jgi:hypothetical protein